MPTMWPKLAWKEGKAVLFQSLCWVIALGRVGKGGKVGVSEMRVDFHNLYKWANLSSQVFTSYMAQAQAAALVSSCGGLPLSRLLSTR